MSPLELKCGLFCPSLYALSGRWALPEVFSKWVIHTVFYVEPFNTMKFDTFRCIIFATGLVGINQEDDCIVLILK